MELHGYVLSVEYYAANELEFIIVRPQANYTCEMKRKYLSFLKILN